MENNKDKFPEQEAPIKNHDDAFVQVGNNGEPVIPQSSEESTEASEKDDRFTTLDKR